MRLCLCGSDDGGKGLLPIQFKISVGPTNRHKIVRVLIQARAVTRSPEYIKMTSKYINVDGTSNDAVVYYGRREHLAKTHIGSQIIFLFALT